jgi:acetolactate synthase-1/2/3 large subunit
MEKPGAVLIELPEDIAEDDIPDVVLPKTTLPKSIPSLQSMDKAIQRINQSQRPFIIAGNGVIRQGASPTLQTFAEALSIR